MLRLTFKEKNKDACVQRAVSRKRGCMPADSFVLIFKCVARRNFCGTPACVKPPPRYLQVTDSAVRRTRAKKILKKRKYEFI